MIWIIISAILTSILSIWLGYRRLFYLYQVTVRNLLTTALAAIVFYSLMLLLFKYELLSEAVAGAIITNVYASIFGFFMGSAFDQYQTRKNSGDILYINRSFFSEHLPVIVAIALITLGVHRSATFSDLAITPIRITSGLSIMAIGVWGITLRLVPEFRKKGIVLLDSIVEWEHFLNYKWYGEEILEIEYEKDESIRSFKTLIPSEDQLKVETMLSIKMKEKLEE
jgi:hypothetical protein